MIDTVNGKTYGHLKVKKLSREKMETVRGAENMPPLGRKPK